MCNRALIDTIVAYSQQNGYRYATKRVAVALVLSQFKSFADADELWFKLRVNHPRISKATVYIALRWLLTAGLIQRRLRQDRVYTYRIVRSFSKTEPKQFVKNRYAEPGSTPEKSQDTRYESDR